MLSNEFLGQEDIGGSPAWKFRRPDGGAAYVSNPIEAYGLGAPIFGDSTAPDIGKVAPIPTPQNFQIDPNSGKGDSANVLGAEFKLPGKELAKEASIEAGLAHGPNRDKFSGGSGAKVSTSAPEQAAGYTAYSDTPLDVEPTVDPAGPEPKQAIASPQTTKPAGDTVTVTRRGEGAAAAEGLPLTEGQKYAQRQAAMVEANRAPLGMQYVPGHAGREAEWQPGQRRGVTLTGTESGDKALMKQREGEITDAFNQREIAARKASVMQLDALNQQRDAGIKQYVGNQLEEVRLGELQKQKQAAYETRRASLDQIQREAENTKIDPARVWHDAGAAQKIMLTIAMGLGAFGAGINGGPNQAKQMLDTFMAADTEKQKSAIEGKKDAAAGERERFGEWMRTNDPAIVEANLKAAKLATIANQAQLMGTMKEYSAIHGALPQFIADLNAERVNTIASRDAMLQKEQSEQYLPEVVASQGGWARKPLTETEVAAHLKNDETIGGVIDAGQGGAEGMVNVIDPATRKSIGRVRKEELSKVREHIVNNRTTVDSIDAMMNMGDALSSTDPKERGMAEEQAKLLANKVFRGVMNRSDAPSGSEQETMDEMAANPVKFFSNTENAKARLKVLRENQVRDSRTFVGAYEGLDPARVNYEMSPETQQ